MANRRLIGGIVLCLALAPTLAAEPPTTAIIGTPPQPNWIQLSDRQKRVLAPLTKDWDTMESIRKKKWLGIADRYPAMKPDEQQRMQDRMREWSKLTPEQRAKIRDTYKDFNQLPPEQKRVVKQKWQAYSNLSDEEKQRLRESGKSAKLLAPAGTAAAPTEATGISSPTTGAPAPGSETTKTQ